MFAAEVIIDKDGRIVFEQQIQDWWPALVTLFEQNPLIAALLVLMCLDIVTGILAAGASGQLSSSVSFKGMCKKGIMIGIIAAAKIMEVVIPGAPLATIGALGFCCVELFSIVENAGRAGVPLPAGLKAAFEKFREKTQREGGKGAVGVTVEVNANKAEVNADTAVMGNHPVDRTKHTSDSVKLSVRDSGEHKP